MHGPPLIFARVKERDPDQFEFFQAFEEVADSLQPLFDKDSRYLQVLKTMAEPELGMAVLSIPQSLSV